MPAPATAIRGSWAACAARSTTSSAAPRRPASTSVPTSASSSAAAGSARSAARSQSAATPGACRRTPAAAARSVAAASTSPGAAAWARCCARTANGAPARASSRAAAAWPASRAPAPSVSCTAVRTTGWRKAKRRGSSVPRMSPRCSITSRASSAGRAVERGDPRREVELERIPGDGRGLDEGPRVAPAATRPPRARPRRCPRARRACRRRARARASSSGLPPDCAKSRSRSLAAGTPASSASAATRSSGRRSRAMRPTALLERCAASRPSAAGPGRRPSATSRESAGGRRTRCSSSSRVAGSAQWTSSMSSRSGRPPAISASSSPSARCRRQRSVTESRAATGTPSRGKTSARRSMRSGSEPLQRTDVREGSVERVDDRHQRDVVLELGRAALEHDEALRRGALAQLGQQPRLADARLATGDEQAPLAARHGVERPRDRLELRITAEQAVPRHRLRLVGGFPRCWRRPRLGPSISTDRRLHRRPSCPAAPPPCAAPTRPSGARPAPRSTPATSRRS